MRSPSRCTNPRCGRSPCPARAPWSNSNDDAHEDTVTVRIAGSCTGTGCASLASVGDVTVVYVPAASIKDVAGNPAAGSFTKSQKMF